MINLQTAKGRRIWLRRPELKDVQSIHALIKANPPLDLNSAYTYLLQAHHYAETCVVAEADGRVVGYLSAYVPPQKPNTLFVWQIAVAASWRGERLAKLMLHTVLNRSSVREVEWLETTIGPSNIASQALFGALARDLATQCQVSPLFGRELFAEEAHEAEFLFKIGPLMQRSVKLSEIQTGDENANLQAS